MRIFCGPCGIQRYMPYLSLIHIFYTNPVFGGFREFFDTFADRIATFVNQVDAGCRPDEIDGSGEDGYRASQVIHAAIESLKTGMPVQVKSITQ